jgi:hypothetical protein
MPLPPKFATNCSTTWITYRSSSFTWIRRTSRPRRTIASKGTLMTAFLRTRTHDSGLIESGLASQKAILRAELRGAAKQDNKLCTCGIG